MKRLLKSVLLIAAMAVILAGCGKGTPKPSGTLVVGTPKMNGDFVRGFGNSSYDNQVRKLLGTSDQSGYLTYDTTPGGEFVLNKPVVKSVETALDASGNKEYKFTLFNDLKWSDGEKLTAKDYVFQMLVFASKAYVDAGAVVTDGDTLVGYKAYHAGETDVFAGVKLYDDYTFSLTINAEELPYFYETTMVAAQPAPMHIWAPGADVESTDAGVKLVNYDIVQAANFVANDYRYKPTVSSGAYKFVSFENDVVTLELNTHYKGNFEGEKPKLEKVIVKYINQTIDVDMVIRGDVDLVAGVIEGEKIEKILASDNAGETHYSRNGYGMLAFHNDFGPTADPLVRKALAYLVDRNQFVTNILGGYGSLVDGEYGLSQWMYTANKAAVESELEHYVFNPEKANELLNQTEWKFEADGTTPFDASKAKEGYFRYNSKKEVLQLNHLGTIENAITDLVQVELPKGAALAGIKFTTESSDFAKLLDNYYEGYKMGAERKYHMFNLATGFTAAYDPYYGSMSCDFKGTRNNPTQTCDTELEAALQEMRKLDPTEKEKYAEIWLRFQKRWNQLMPVIPLYSNQYYDVFNKRVSGLATTPVFDWAQGISYISVTE